MKKKLTVTVGIPAHNEESNITNMLRSVIRQKAETFILKKIIVFADNCTDTTEKKVLLFAKKNKNVALLSDKERKGKVMRLNQLYKLNTSDILINFDADIVLASVHTIEEMVKIFLREKKTVMVAAHQIPIRPQTFAGKIIYAGYQFWDRTRLAVKNYDHIQNHYGAATALRKSFVKNFQFPADITDDRGYLYIMAKKYGNFRYAIHARIFYRPVENLKEFCKLADRSFKKNQDALVQYFSNNVYDMYHIPLKYKIHSILITFLKSPFFTILALLLNIYTRVFPKHDMLYGKGMWEICTSTKKAIIEATPVNIPSF